MLLVKVLNEAHVAQDICMEGFEGIIENITFAEEDIPVKGRGHSKALQVSVKFMDHIVAKVLVNNGSLLNVIPGSTLNKLPFNVSHLKPSSMIVRAFDGTRRNIIGEIDLQIQVGPHFCQITFQVMDINLAYNCLLGRPWIHSVGVVLGEEDILVSCPSSMPYVEAVEESLETTFQSFEIVSNASVESFSMRLCMSDSAIMVARVMLYDPEMGLGKNNDGVASLVEFKENCGRFGLGYRPMHADVRRSTLERRSRGISQQPRPQVKEATLCHISKSFVSAGWRCEEQVALIHDDAP